MSYLLRSALTGDDGQRVGFVEGVVDSAEFTLHSSLIFHDVVLEPEELVIVFPINAVPFLNIAEPGEEVFGEVHLPGTQEAGYRVEVGG